MACGSGNHFWRQLPPRLSTYTLGLLSWKASNIIWEFPVLFPFQFSFSLSFHFLIFPSFSISSLPLQNSHQVLSTNERTSCWIQRIQHRAYLVAMTGDKWFHCIQDYVHMMREVLCYTGMLVFFDSKTSSFEGLRGIRLLSSSRIRCIFSCNYSIEKSLLHMDYLKV